jgi:hypothetical protein
LQKPILNNKKQKMKKILLSAAVLLSATAFAQTTPTSKFGWKLGLLTSLPTDTDIPATRIALGSTTGEVNYKLSKKITATGSLSYIRYNSSENVKFAQVPVTVGARYAIDQQFYFGASTGLAFYNKKEFGTTDFIYSPYVGMQIKKIAVNFNYINTVKDEPIKVLALSFNYTL